MDPDGIKEEGRIISRAGPRSEEQYGEAEKAGKCSRANPSPKKKNRPEHEHGGVRATACGNPG